VERSRVGARPAGPVERSRVGARPAGPVERSRVGRGEPRWARGALSRRTGGAPLGPWGALASRQGRTQRNGGANGLGRGHRRGRPCSPAKVGAYLGGPSIQLQPLFPPFALASLLVGLAATAQAAPAGRSVVLTGKAGESPLIYLAPGTVTAILLGAPILRESVQVEGRARFAVFEVSDQGVTLSPAMALGTGERLALRVTYREGSPSSVVFLLTGQAGTADGLVNVSRPPQTVEACRVELAATRERCEAQAKELEELKARHPAVSPAAVALAGVVDLNGMRGENFGLFCFEVRGELRPVKCRGLGASTWSVVVLEVSNTGAEPWAPAWAEVTSAAGGEPRRARAVLSGQAAIPPGGSVSVAVEVEMPAREPGEWLSAVHALRVCNGDGSRCLSAPQLKL
jgi:uncharacterized protein (TIGR02268 family)